MSISHIFSALCKHKKLIVSLLSIVGLFFLFWETALAGDQELLSAEESAKVVGILNGIIVGAASIMWMITSFITIFLYPGWVNGTLFGLQDYLKEIWILVSNVVYFIFAFIIIVIAFMNIIWKWEGNWELKQAMPKFIIWVLIVPFSWFFIQFVLAISAILTVWVLTLPYDSFQDQSLLGDALEGTELGDSFICKDVIISFSWEFEEGATDFSAWDSDVLSENIKCASEESRITVQQLFTGTEEWEWLDNSIFWVISVYTYGILKVQDLDTLYADDLTTVSKMADLVFKILFDLLFIIIYLLLMVALFLALLVRWIRLWIYAMLSPAFGLLYFFWKTGEGFGESWDKFNIKEFIALALVPVYVAAALSFGLIFILVATEWLKESASENDLDQINAGWFSLSIIWAHGSGEQEVSVIGKLIVELFGVVILWIAVMAALGASKTTKAVVEPIAAFWKSVGELATKAPTYAPIIPTWNGAMSVTGLQQVWWSLTSAAEQSARSRGSDFAKNLPGTNPGQIDLSNKSINALTSFENNGNKITRESLWDLRKAIEEGWSITTLASDPEFIRTINHIMKTDPAFANNALLQRPVAQWRPQDLAQALSEMDKVIDQNYSSAWTLMAWSESWSTARINDVNQRLFGEGSGTDTPTETTNNITISGLGASSVYANPQEAANAFRADTSYGGAAAVRTKLNAEWIENATVEAIIEAYEWWAEAESDTTTA